MHQTLHSLVRISFLLTLFFLSIHFRLPAAQVNREYRVRGYGSDENRYLNWHGQGWPSYYAYYRYPVYGSTYQYSYPLYSTYHYSYPSYYTNYSYPSYPYNGSFYINQYPVPMNRLYRSYPIVNRTYSAPSRQVYQARSQVGVFLNR